MRQVHDGNSAEALPTAAEQTSEVDNILFSSPSLYTIIGVLTLAVLFCAGVLAYTVRRNDLLKSEYYRLMAAVAERGSKGARSTFDPDFPDTVETMGPGPKVEDTTRDVLMLLVTRKPISNISHSNRTRRTATASVATRAVYYDDLDSGPRRPPNGTRTPGVSANEVLVVTNHTVTRTSSSLDSPSTSLEARLTTFEASLNEVAGSQVYRVSPAVAATNVTAAEAIGLTLKPVGNATGADANATLSDEEYDVIESSERPEAGA